LEQFFFTIIIISNRLELPGANKSIFKRLLRFLVKLLKFEMQTRMGVKNLAVVFGPPLMRAPGDDPLQEVCSNDKCVSVVACIDDRLLLF
jgi:hypothetical protein